ncbi:hypothetical protein CBS101457_001740 [Exobasidium rhododendri]|nr:hypothetical protein CBS101457_001740 [Exobasidium rhododendri]
MGDTAHAWRDSSAFLDLSESWIEAEHTPASTSAIASQVTRNSLQTNLTTEPGSNGGVPGSVSSEEGSSSNTATVARAVSLPGSSLPSIDIKKKKKKRRGGDRNSPGRLSDSELLQAGPSSPSLRIASHKRSASDEPRPERESCKDERDLDEERRKGIQMNEPASPLPSSESIFSTSSEEKSGSHTRTTLAGREGKGGNVGDDYDDDEDEDDDEGGSQFQSAIDGQGMATTTEEATFIEHSHVDDNPQRLPAFNIKEIGQRADMFRRKELKLQSMWKDMSMLLEQGQSKGVEQVAQRLEVNDSSEREVEIEMQEAAPKDLREVGEESSVSMEIIAGEEEEREGEEDEAERGWQDEADKSSDLLQDAAELIEDAHSADVPQCIFTFASPVLKSEKLVVPSTPSVSHGLMRLLPRGTHEAEIEHILNTPRSERKAGDAHQLVSRLVEQDRSERERKRLRVDERPKTDVESVDDDKVQLWQRSTAQISKPLNGDAQSGEIEIKSSAHDESPRDYVRNAPAFKEQLKLIRFPSEASSKSSASSLLVSRRGEKAPTPEPSSSRGRPLRPLGKGQSPRKILRLWSAANQVDEEIEEEKREAAEEEWQDIPESTPATSGHILAIPVVSIDPPTQKGLENILQQDTRETVQRGMLQIGPEDVNTAELESMANGRMTFDKTKSKWVPAKTSSQRDGEQIDSSNETSDPFRDIESFASQSLLVEKRSFHHAPKSQSALRNEVQMSRDTTASTSHFSESIRDVSLPSLPATQQQQQQHRYLSAPKSPSINHQSHQSSTPRSILKTGRSLLTPENRSPMTNRQEPRSISFADGNQIRSQQRVEKVEELLRQLAQLALGPDDSVDEIDMRRQETPTRMLNFTPTGNNGARSPWNLSMLRGPHGDGKENASFLTNASFHVAHDKILELITDVAPWEPGWQGLKFVNLSKRRVESVIRLKDFLPSLEEAVLDDNEISYLTGLPSSLRILSIARNRLPPTVSFGHLKNLESLDVSFNHVDDSLMSLRELVHLRHLRAESTGVSSMEGIQGLSKLESVNLRGNDLQVINIAANQWPRLKDLILSHNDIVTVRGLSSLKRLRCLNLDHNNLSSIDLGTRMSRLKQLRLSGNTALLTLDVGPAKNLCTLYADDCSLQEVKNIDQLQKLDNLSLRQQNGSGYGIDWPGNKIRDIKRLFLSGNAFCTIDLTNRAFPSTTPPSMTRFYSMVYLELSACQLTSLPLDLPELVPNLRQLNADYNLFETLPVLRNLQRLKRFSIIGCRIKKSRKLVESLTGCDELAVFDVRMNPCTMGLYPPIVLSATSTNTSSTVHGMPQLNKAFLPPFPNPTISRPDVPHFTGNVQEEQRHQDSEGALEEGSMNKSFFHKRTPAPDLSSFSANEGDQTVEASKSNALFVASDNRFVRTLPAQYRLQRLLHRGALAMACPNLAWLDGLLIDEKEVHQADEYFQGRLYPSKETELNQLQSSDADDDYSSSISSSLL